MVTPVSYLCAALRRFRRRDDGGPTVEFAILIGPLILFLVSTFEMGLLMTRHVMLERGLDMAVREVRLNTGSLLSNDASIAEAQFKAMVCNAAGIIPDCTDQLRLEMVTVRLFDQNAMSNDTIPREASCIDENDPFGPPRNFTNGNPNEMMIVRACARLVPMLPDTGIGWMLSRMDAGYYRLTATSAFVMEPL